MLALIKRDMILYKKHLAYLMPALSISLILLYPEADRGYFIIGVPVVFFFSILLFVQDDRGIQQLLSMPFSRRDIARGRFAAGWALMGAGMLYITVLGFVLGLAYPEALASFMGFLNPRTLFIYLWFLSGMTFIAYPILFIFLGKGVKLLLTVALAVNVLLGVFFLLRFNAGGPDIGGLIKTVTGFLYNYHISPVNFVISGITLILINGINLKLCEWIFSRKEF